MNTFKNKNLASIFWKNELIQIETKVDIMERKLDGKSNKGGMKSRQRRMTKREEKRNSEENESWKEEENKNPENKGKTRLGYFNVTTKLFITLHCPRVSQL